MTHFQKLRLHPTLIWVSSNFSEYPSFRNIFPCYTVHNHSRFYNKRALVVEENENDEIASTSNGEIARKISPNVRKEAQGALLDYLHSTRSLHFLDAEHMSKNSPHFLKKLIANVSGEPSVGRSMARFFRYHPINEFEPFFESIGLQPSEFVPLLPRDLMFLSDEDGLLDNYHVLCEYGVARDKIGKIFREAREVFRYGHGVLKSKLQAFQEMGLSQSLIAKAVSYSPYLLIGDVGNEFVKVVVKLKGLGREYNWIEGHLLKNTFYNWRQIYELLCLLHDLGCKDEEIGILIGQHPEFLFDGSGRTAFSLIGFLLKFGCTKNDIRLMFLQFPKTKVGNFVWNLRRFSDLLIEVEMETASIGRIFRSHFTVLGSYSLKKSNSILARLNTGKKRMCKIIISNPLELKNWTLGAKIKPLPVDTHPHEEKIKFLVSIDFVENSKEMERALKAFRGKGEELQGRFDCLVKAGLGQKDVAGMVKMAPQILNQSEDVIEAKIRLLVNDLGYPVSCVKSFPAFLSYTSGRIKLRYSMFKWLADQGAVRPTLSLSTFVACTESYFVEKYVRKHPRGPQVWEEMKKTIST